MSTDADSAAQKQPTIEHTKTKIQDLCARRRFYSVNREYQREEDIWSGEDKKYLIDSIIKGFDIPKIYLRELPDQSLEIVDGQQRIDTIWKFRDDKITLSGEITGKEFDGKQFSDVRDAVQQKFNDYELDTVVLKNYDDERIRELFTRLQRGKPLNPAERLNAFAGTIVLAMRFLGKHEFFALVDMTLARYHSYIIAARMLFIQYALDHYNGLGDIGPNPLYAFFIEQKKLTIESREVQAVKANLDYLYSAFRQHGGKVPELSSEVWVINAYLLVTTVRKLYAMRGKEADFAEFFIKFWKECEGLKKMNIRPTLNSITNEFVAANSSGTGSKENLEIRRDEMLANFVKQVQGLELLDPNRLYEKFEKVVIYRNNKLHKCANCGKEVTWNEYEADHVKPWSAGGKTTLDNGQLLCRDCNREKAARI